MYLVGLLLCPKSGFSLKTKVTIFLNLLLWRLHHSFGSGRSKFVDRMRREAIVPVVAYPVFPLAFTILLFIPSY